MPETETDLSTEKIDAKLDQLRAEVKPLQKQMDNLQSEIKQLERHRRELSIPYRPGDIVQDEKGVEYRVTDFNTYGKTACNGIRLTKAGHEAHQKPRPIYSNKLKKVN